MVSFPLLKLPLELVTRILSFLYIPDLVSCQLTDRFLFNVIKDSVLLRYLIATEAACVEDNPHCNLSLSERLEQLKRREEAWSCCRIDFRREVPLQRKSTSIYDLTGGVYLLGDSRNGDLTSFRRPLTTGLSYLTLPSLSSHEPTWSRLDIKRNIIDIGLAIHEHDLIAIVTSTKHEMDPSSSKIEIVLIKFSTGTAHPFAECPSLYVDKWTAQSGRPGIAIEIVGRHLALVTTYPISQRMRDTLYVYDWKKGVLKMEHNAGYPTYSGLVFLSADIIVLPNTTDQTLDLWRIPDSPGDLNVKRTHALSLPRLIPGRRIRRITCRGEPNPIAQDLTFISPASPFHCSPAESIIVFHIFVEPLPAQVGGSFILIVHRRSLLSLFPDTHSHDALESNAHSMDVTPWAEWGPPVTRWFNADNIPTRWITTTAGQRCVVRADALVEPFPIVILDFNPYNVRRKAREQKDKPTSRAWVVTGRDAFSELGMFEERVDSRLPFFVFESMQHFDFDGVLMDEERILGIRTDASDTVTSVEVLHLG